MAYTLEEMEKGYCHIEDGPTYECYFPKERRYWNGWAVPVGLTATSLVDFVIQALAGQKTEDDYEFCLEVLTSIRPHYFVSEMWDGESDGPLSEGVTIYGVGDGLIWTECDAQGEE